MLSFTPTDEQQMLIDTLRRYAESDIRAAAHEADENGEIPASVLDAGWEIGLILASIPEEYDGFGEQEALTGVLALEELAWGDLAVALKLMAPALFAYPIMMFGSEAQKEVYLPLVCEDDYVALTAALAEPGIFFDASALATTAKVEGNSIILTGVKSNVPLAAEVKHILVYARDSADDEVAAYIVPADAAGVLVGDREKLMGIRALPTYTLTLEDVRIEAAAKVAVDFAIIQQHNQIAQAALAVGVARAAYDFAREYAKTREQFGGPIAQKQAIAFMLAEMAIEVDAARLMVWEAAWKRDRGEDAAQEAYLAAQYAAKTALFVADSGVQILGGYGFMREYPVERFLRNARGFAMFNGLAMV